jgi:hypothetical protein
MLPPYSDRTSALKMETVCFCGKLFSDKFARR